MLRAVLDTNVYIAALLAPGGACASVISALRDGAYDAVVCPQLLAELDSVLRREKFSRYLEPDDVSAYVDWVARAAIVRPDSEKPERHTSDAGDDFLVALALSSSAPLLVIGDEHLLRCRAAGVRMVSVRAFADLVGLL